MKSIIASGRILRCMGLYCEKNESDLIDVVSFFIAQLEGHRRLHGINSTISVAFKMGMLSPKVQQDICLRLMKKNVKLSCYNIKMITF